MAKKSVRRSRIRRSPTGKHVQLTLRDLEILRWLYRYRFLRSTQLTALLHPRSNKRFIERLGDLYHETGLIDRPKAQWRSFDARYQPVIYELTAKGQNLLENHSALPGRVTSLARRGRPGATPQFDHAMMIVDALVEAELETIANPNQRFVCVDEILEKAPQATRDSKKPLAITVALRPSSDMPQLKSKMDYTLIPDGLYGIAHNDPDKTRYEFFALECENTSPKRRSSTKLSSLQLKQAAYRILIDQKLHRRVWGLPNLKLKVCGKS